MQTENNMTPLAPPQVAPVMRETLATETANGTVGVAASISGYARAPFADDGAA
jgi:hypothetical protein